MMRKDATDAAVESCLVSDWVKLWCVYDVVQGDVESYHPSYAWAMDQLDREADSRSAIVRAAVREVQATFSGQAYRVVTTAWDRYRAILQVAAESHELASRECLLRHAALGSGRSRRVAKAEMRRLKSVSSSPPPPNGPNSPALRLWPDAILPSPRPIRPESE